jgi:glycolate dehydrogenase iron-sulfur subunit
MQTQLADFIRTTPEGLEAEAILRKCVHCGFCTATCPTYQLLGDDLDSPRGRIYLMKSALEGGPITERTRLHLDRCLTCRACETACPSGVKYGRLVDIGRNLVESRTTRSVWDRCKRSVLGFVLPRTALFRAALRVGQFVRAVLPRTLRAKIPPPASAPGTWPAPRHQRRMLALAGCVQAALAPSINAAAARVLDRLGISLVEAPNAGCCGALRFHLNDQRGGLDDMRRLIDAWWPFTEQKQTEAICMTASGCGVTVGEYAHHFANDPDHRVRAARISLLARDVAEVVAAEAPALEKLLAARKSSGRVAFHSPCTLQHGQQIHGVVEGLLQKAGYELTPVADAQLCCGSAGTYSILQPELSLQLRARKITALESGAPATIATANIGCLAHLQGGTARPVRHWIELLDEALQE